jgi:hypothetical protein
MRIVRSVDHDAFTRFLRVVYRAFIPHRQYIWRLNHSSCSQVFLPGIPDGRKVIGLAAELRIISWVA